MEIKNLYVYEAIFNDKETRDNVDGALAILNGSYGFDLSVEYDGGLFTVTNNDSKQHVGRARDLWSLGELLWSFIFAIDSNPIYLTAKEAHNG